MSPSTRPAPAPPSLDGTATRAGTARYAARYASRFTDDYFRALGDAHGSARGGPRSSARGSTVVVGSIGIGTYLGECTDAEDARHEAAVVAALGAGCNVVDTAINYRCQRSERAVGQALARAVADGVARRDEIVVCTKGGFVALDGAPPATREAYDAYLERELFAPGVLAPSELAAGGHSIAPRFLAHAIARSRANLGVDTIDVYYLHEPERQHEALDATAYGVALRQAAAALEDAVQRGAIARWGVASWRGLRVPPGAKGHLALADVVAAARDVAGNAHHLAAVQAPISLAMPEAVRAPTQTLPDGRVVPLLQAVQELGLPMIASASLAQAQLAANLPVALHDAFPGCESDAQRALTFVRGLPGVAVALVGMRTPAHLAENLRSAR